MFDEYVSNIQHGMHDFFIALYIPIFHPIVLSIILYPVLVRLTKRNHIIAICIFFALIAAAVPLFHFWLFLTISNAAPIVFKVTIGMMGVCVMFYSLVFEVFLRPALLKAWYGKKLYKEMFTAPDYTDRLERYSHSTRVKILGNAMALSVIITVIAIMVIGFCNYYPGKIVIYAMFVITYGIYLFHMYITQHLFKCDCCGRKVLHFVHEHPVYKSWIRQAYGML